MLVVSMFLMVLAVLIRHSVKIHSRLAVYFSVKKQGALEKGLHCI